jgi:hypothetical protein
MIGYGTCVGSWEKYAKYLAPWIAAGPRPSKAITDQPSIAIGYNRILDHFRGQVLDAVILLHDDLEILDPGAEAKLLAPLADPDVALVGVAGGKSDQSLHWWRGEKVGHQFTDSGLLDFGPRDGDVAFIEGSIMMLSPWAVDNLRFDERYPGFSSGYDDICLHALEAGKRVTVVDVSTHHHSTVGWKSPEREAEFERSERLFAQKWGIR